MEQIGHTDPNVTLGIYARAVRNGRRSARSQRRLAALSVDAAEALDRAALGTSEPDEARKIAGETVA